MLVQIPAVSLPQLDPSATEEKWDNEDDREPR